jgi:uncharacterized protein (UPF0332 family)
MNQEQQDLLSQAQNSLEAAKLLYANGYFGFSASRAYYSMFYVAEALLIGKGLSFSKHSAVGSAFGKYFVKTGIVSSKFHQYLIKGMEVRHAGDYGKDDSVTPDSAREQIAWGTGEIAKSKLLDGFEVGIDDVII